MKKTSTNTASPLVLQRETLANLTGGGSMAEYLTVLATISFQATQQGGVLRGTPGRGGSRRP